MTDRELLHEYLVYTSDSAFADLVRRHVDLVYRTCRRDTEDDRLAEAATQDVFSMLAHKAGSIHDDATIVEWLFERSRVMAKNILARELRDLPRAEPPTLDRLLNEALASLPVTDREALLLRVCEKRNLHDVAEEIGVSEDIVKGRVADALTQLRAFLEKRGVNTQAEGLEEFLKQNAAAAAPISAATVAETALGTKRPAAVGAEGGCANLTGAPVPAPSSDTVLAPAPPRRRTIGPIIAAVTTVIVICVAGLWMLTLTPSGAPAKLQPPPIGPTPSQVPAAANADTGSATVAGTNDPFAAKPDTVPTSTAPEAAPSKPAPTRPTAPRKPTATSAPDVPTTPDGLIPGPTTAPATPAAPPSTTLAPTDRVLGIVTGEQPNAVIMEDGRERIVAPGDTIDAGRVLSISKDNVTISAPDGRVINLPVSSTSR